MLTLILEGLRHRTAALLAIVVSAGLGSALIVMCGAMIETGIRLSAPAERIGAADLVVIGDPSYTMLNRDGEQTTDLRPLPERHRLSASAAAAADGIDGVAQIVPVMFLDSFARSAARALPLTAQNWPSVAVSGIDPVPAAGPAAGEVVLTAAAADALAAGEDEDLLLTMEGRTLSVRTAAVIGGPEDPATVFFSEEAAGNPLDALGVVLAPDADLSVVRAALQAELADVRVLAGDGRGAAEDPAVSAARIPAIVVGAVTGGIVLTVLATVISGVVALSVRQRSREISLLRATGATGRQVRALVVGEVMAAGLLGALLGLVPGIPLAYLLHLGMQAGGALPKGLELSSGPVPLAAAAAVTGLVIWLAAGLAARTARCSRPIDAMREAELPPARIGIIRWLAGILFGLGAVALAVLTFLMPPALVSATAGPAVLAGTISAALLAPAYLRLGVAVLRPVMGDHRHGVAGLAGTSIRARAAALSTVTGAAALVFGIGAGNLVSSSMLTAAAADAQVETITADAVVTGAAGAAAERADEIAALPEVDAATPFVTSGGWIERPYDASHRDRHWPVRGLDGAQAQEVLSNRLVAGDFADLTGASVALPVDTAAALGVDIGDTIGFRFGDGDGAELRVAAAYEDLPGYENLLLPVELLTAHTSDRAPAALLVSASDGTAAEAVAPAVEGALNGHPSLRVGDRGALEASLQEGLNINALINGLLLLVVLAYAMVAVTNTVAVSTLGRRRELAMLRLTGATRAQVRRLLITETAVCAAVGIAIAVIAACAAVLPTAVVVGASPLAPLPLAIAGALCAAVALTTLPVAAMTARRAMRGPLSATADTM
ncbi:FtsX-like permease family protein [Arthrobacter sp. zg-Y1116]|uniref:FtsX-like permease family protein n=1 Tax=Arthrobacter sp. zg-Y1116 TaxID=2964611 RepID=UPI00210401C4|nr:ABC transporter permease [Arthrobacter sp. zg-Y1116]MCQ1947825.1 ABC transporter permease [Arthrobacter sp. zg-Y1116]